MTQRFHGKRILVTGATSGIGREGALRIAREGGSIIATGRDEDKLATLRAELPGNNLIVSNDAAAPDTGIKLASILETGRPLDGLWLNAGFAEVADVESIDADFFDRMMAANVRGPVLQMAALADRLADGASVVVTSSTSTYEGSSMASVYAATKAALIALARCWASALGERDIRVNALVPGPIDTEFRSFMTPAFRKQFEADVTSRLALSRVGTAEEAASVALFLLSDDASFVTGAQYAVDGGLVMN